ncbi:MAG: hypothetical protein ACRD3H_04515 [Terriglobales bacterium]
MKRMGYIFLAEVVLTGVLVSLASAQSEPLGDYARSVRKTDKKEAAKKYDNDNLPKTDNISIVGAAPETTAEDANPGAQSEGNAAAPADSTAVTPEAQPQDDTKKADKEEAQKATDEWKQRFSEQKTKVDLLARELDVAQREYRLRAAAFYADAGNRLRNQGSWDKEDAQYKQQIAQKQKALDDAKKALDNMKEQGRKSGIPPRDRE